MTYLERMFNVIDNPSHDTDRAKTETKNVSVAILVSDNYDTYNFNIPIFI